MAIKARPYGGKPGIAVAKETKSRLLTLWTLKLRGATAPVAQNVKNQCESKQNTGKALIIVSVFLTLSTRRRDVTAVRRQRFSARQSFYQSIVCISHEARNIQHTVKSIRYEHSITPLYSLSTAA